VRRRTREEKTADREKMDRRGSLLGHFGNDKQKRKGGNTEKAVPGRNFRRVAEVSHRGGETARYETA